MLIRGVFIHFICASCVFLYFLVISPRLLCVVSTLLYCTSRIALAGVDILFICILLFIFVVFPVSRVTYYVVTC